MLRVALGRVLADGGWMRPDEEPRHSWICRNEFERARFMDLHGTAFNWDEVFARGDAELYRAKADGRDCVAVESPVPVAPARLEPVLSPA